jgi:formylglycine-generating enzyme required for sulfatase activity
MHMLAIPPGSFTRSVGGGDASEQVVTLTRAFWLSDRETSLAQFERFVDDSTCPAEEKPAPAWTAPFVEFKPTREHPVAFINYFDAILYCNWLSRGEGMSPCYTRKGSEWEFQPQADGYRLPTEAEWEYACRAGTTTAFAHGDDESLLAAYGVFAASHPASCGGKLPNGFGLFDLHGNLEEWCLDRWQRDYRQAGVKDPLGPPQGTGRVLRGGSYQNGKRRLLSANRGYGDERIRLDTSGFRVARTHRR